MNRKYKPILNFTLKMLRKKYKDGYMYRMANNLNYRIIVKSDCIYYDETKKDMYIFYFDLDKIEIYDIDENKIIKRVVAPVSSYRSNGYVMTLPIFSLKFDGEVINVIRYDGVSFNSITKEISLDEIINLVDDVYRLRYLPLVLV